MELGKGQELRVHKHSKQVAFKHVKINPISLIKKRQSYSDTPCSYGRLSRTQTFCGLLLHAWGRKCCWWWGSKLIKFFGNLFGSIYQSIYQNEHRKIHKAHTSLGLFLQIYSCSCAKPYVQCHGSCFVIRFSPNKPIITQKYCKLKMHLIHLTYRTSQLNLTFLTVLRTLTLAYSGQNHLTQSLFMINY